MKNPLKSAAADFADLLSIPSKNQGQIGEVFAFRRARRRDMRSVRKFFFLFVFIRYDFPVGDLDDSISVCLRKLAVVRYHDDELLLRQFL